MIEKQLDRLEKLLDKTDKEEKGKSENTSEEVQKLKEQLNEVIALFNHDK